ncbi:MULTISPECIES: hypothetical protein [Shewanella]|uniref:Uncharacterized protein n=1 Tax=Shewanella algae TaxID=38313 RepID=A0A5N5U286_9GAMM|nr:MULTISPECIES: hypothetical protein [Shewanella]MBO2596033.1 N-acetyltransferase [Shewanella algae]MBO2667390.1 N-acetyltransferase [Shewanella algae]NJI83798.1 N-acetyltransferase [Shewanella sp. Iso12]NKZ43631.1 N-acetyltransferase [Shewanella algae]QTE76809.1 N-acetyltransferase [Shewanella algae]
MSSINFISLDKINPEEFIPILNKVSTRNHLITHDEFDSSSVRSWIDEKLNEDKIDGCIVRAIETDGILVGWCGIQSSELGFEIAIVLDNTCWGIGKDVFNSLIYWTKDYGHKIIYIHLLHTRPEYHFLRRMSQRVFQTEMLGDRFTTYELNVDNLVYQKDKMYIDTHRIDKIVVR